MQKLSTETQVSDIKGKTLPAVYVFSQAIKYLMDHLDDALKTKGIEIQEGDIEWVLTVPAIWNDPAKQFMRQAAEMVFKIKTVLTIIFTTIRLMLGQLLIYF